MAIVVDTSAVIAVAGNEPTKSRLIDLTRGQDLVAPTCLRWEIGNAISAMFKQRRITLAQGLALFLQFEQIPITVLEITISEAIKMASDHTIYAYDAYMPQCARQTASPILTLDGGLAYAAGHAGIDVLKV